jgi:hypothetical protein
MKAENTECSLYQPLVSMCKHRFSTIIKHQSHSQLTSKWNLFAGLSPFSPTLHVLLFGSLAGPFALAGGLEVAHFDDSSAMTTGISVLPPPSFTMISVEKWTALSRSERALDHPQLRLRASRHTVFQGRDEISQSLLLLKMKPQKTFPSGQR